MADPLTSTLRLTQPTVGGDSGAWGTLLNSDMAYIDAGINGILSITVTTTAITLEAEGDINDQARYEWYQFTGTPGGNCTATLPANQKIGLVTNSTTGGFNMVLTTGSGGTITVQPNQTVGFYCDGTNVAVLPWGSPGIKPAIGVTGTTTLTVAEAGSFVEVQSGTSYTITIPTPVGNAGLNYDVAILPAVSGTITFSTPAGDINGTMGSGAATAPYYANTFFRLVSDGTNWIAGGPGGTVTSLAAVGQLNANGNEALLYINSSAQNISESTSTVITGWTKVSDRLNANFNASTGVYTCPANGFYSVSAGAACATEFDGGMSISVNHNNGTNVLGALVAMPGTAGNPIGATCSGTFFMTAGDTLWMTIFQTVGSPSVQLYNQAQFNFFSVARIP